MTELPRRAAGGAFLAPALALTLAFVLALAAATTAFAGNPDPRTIMRRNFFASKTETMGVKMEMSLISPEGGVRRRIMDFTGKLQKNGVYTDLVIRFRYPPDVEGTGFLLLENPSGDDNLWVYLPALHKVRRLVAHDKKDSFFGSDFSYGDILPPKVDLFRHTLLRMEPFAGHECYVVASVPKDGKEMEDSGYSKRITWVREDNFLESKVEYYDTDGRPLKTQLISGAREVDPARHKWFALRREMINGRTGHRTVIVFSHIVVNKPVPGRFFSEGGLKRQ